MDNSNNPLHMTASNRNLGPVFLGVDWTVFILSTSVVLIRLYTRIWITRNVGWDDAMMALTQVRNPSKLRVQETLTRRVGDNSGGQRLRGHRDELRTRPTQKQPID